MFLLLVDFYPEFGRGEVNGDAMDDLFEVLLLLSLVNVDGLFMFVGCGVLFVTEMCFGDDSKLNPPLNIFNMVA